MRHGPFVNAPAASDPPGKALAESRRARIAPFLAMDVLAEAQRLESAGRSIIHMELGQPSAPAPRAAIAAAQAALSTGRIGYTEALGMPHLREAIARHYQDRYQLAVPAERIVVTTGSSGGFVLAFLALFDPGDRIAIAAPGYPAYRNILEALGLVPVEIPTGPHSGHALTAALVASAHARVPLAGVLAMSPANPTGVVTGPAALAELSTTCRRLGLRFISDEIYHGLTYGASASTALAHDDDAIVINSFSKYFCMTGWRVGWMVVPRQLVRVVECLQQSLSISVPMLSQIAAAAAFGGVEELETVREGYARNRALLMQELPALGLGNATPTDGAFYIYVDVSSLTNDSVDFCRRALREAGVAMTAGVDFDRVEGHRHLRLSYAGREADIREAVSRLKAWLPTKA